jgi:putative transposase
MAIKKKGEEKNYRQYPLKNNMTYHKKQIILNLIQKYKKISHIIQSDIIKEFQKTGYINKYISYKDLSSYQKIYKIFPKTAYIQMALTQVIEMLISRESNIQNTITLFIEKLSNIPNQTKHFLHILNNQSKTKLASSKMIFGHKQGIQEHLNIINTHRIKNTLHKSFVNYQKELQNISPLISQNEHHQETHKLKEKYQHIQKDDIQKLQFISYNPKNKIINNIIIPDSIYTLYKQIYNHITKKWNYPSCKNIAMRIDSRCMELEKPTQAFQSHKLLYWLKLKLINSVESNNGKKKFDISIPLLKNEYFLSKHGILANSVFIGLDQTGQLFIRIMKDMTESIKQVKEKYQQMIQKKYKQDNVLALDFGLRVMFTDQKGNQYGRKWFLPVQHYDSLIQNRVKHLKEKEQNPKLSEDKIYVSLVQKCRNYIKNEINRVLIYIVKSRNPHKLVLENIRFVNPDLSKSMNRLVQNCGRKVISSKLESIKEEYGIEVEYVNPAYTSQICSSCGKVHSESRKGDIYECIECGNILNADVNASRNILIRYLMNKESVSLKDKGVMEPCSISLSMSKNSVRNAVKDISFLKMFYVIKARIWDGIIAREPMMGNCL